MLGKLWGFISGLLNYYKADPSKAHLPARLPIGVEPKPVFEIPSGAAAWKGIVWHHSATPDSSYGNEWDAIKRYHTSYRVNGNIVTKEQYDKAVASGVKGCEKPWSDIGYHLGIERVNGKLEVKIGRSWAKAGAHAGLPGTNKFNREYLGCCLVGSFDNTPPDDETMALVVAVTRHIIASLGIDKSNVIGHREVYDRVGVPRQKTCPGTAFDMDDLRGEL